jgi:transglutaminase-like putative cysteine protease
MPYSVAQAVPPEDEKLPEKLPMFRIALLISILLFTPSPNAFGQQWALEYTPSHRATFEQQWKYSFPKYHSTRWVIALRYPPQLAWSKDVEGKAELLTSTGWKPFKEVSEDSPEKRRMVIIDYPHDDPKLHGGFTVRTTLTATICDQVLTQGKPAKPVKPLTAEERKHLVAATDTFDFNKPNVKDWMDQHKMWIRKNEKPLDFVYRVYKELRLKLPYETKDGGPWICSQILKVGYGECCRHGIVGTSILRANKIPARTVCALWAIDEKSKGAHCWGEFFLDGVGWVPYDTTIGDNKQSDEFFAIKKGEHIAGMIDFDWVIDAGPFGKKTVFAIDAFPAFWGEGKGDMNNEKLDTTTSVRILKRFR